MARKDPSPASQTTLTSSFSFIVIQFEGLRSIDVSEVKQIYGIINSALQDIYGFLGSSRIPFDIVAHKEDVAIIRVPSKVSLDFVSATSLMGSSGDTPCHLVFHGCYPTLLSAVRKVELLVKSTLLSF